MKKRKMSYRTARLVLESAEVQVPVEVDQQYNIVTAMDGIELNPGTMVNVTKVTDKQIEFKVVDTESTYSTDYDTFVTHCQLQSNNVNESFVDESIDKAKVSKLVSSIYDYGNEGHEQKLIPTYKKIAKRANLENADYKKIISVANEEELQDLYKAAMTQAKAIAKAEKYSGVSDSDRDKMKALLEKEFVNESAKDLSGDKRCFYTYDNDSTIVNVRSLPVAQAIHGAYTDKGLIKGFYSDNGLYRIKIASKISEQDIVNAIKNVKSKFTVVKNDNASYDRHTPLDEALSPADTARLTTIISSTYAMVNYAHVLHNNDFDAPNVNAVHLALETLYTELPTLADELGEACRFDYDITLDSSVVINEANPVKACFDLRNDLLSLQKDMPGYINSMIDGINALLTSVMYKMVRLGGLSKPTIAIVTEAEARGWSEYSTQERLNALKLAIMSDSLVYDAEDYVSKDLKDMPKELQAALEVVTAVNESEAQDAYREFFRKKLEEFGAKSPAELSEQQKKDFFNQIKQEWPDAKEEMLNESTSNMVGSVFANYFAKAEDKKKSQVADMLDIEKTATPEQIAKAFDSATSNDQETCCKILSIDESVESNETNKVAFARAYADCNDIKKIQKIDEILLKAGQRVSTSIDVAFAAVKPEVQKELCKIVGIDWMNESKSNVNLNRKRSVIAALKYVNEELEVGAELKCLKDLTTTDGTVIPAESTVSYTGIDSNTNVATVTFDENSYAVTIPDLTAATQQMGPAI